MERIYYIPTWEEREGDKMVSGDGMGEREIDELRRRERDMGVSRLCHQRMRSSKPFSCVSLFFLYTLNKQLQYHDNFPTLCGVDPKVFLVLFWF